MSWKGLKGVTIMEKGEGVGNIGIIEKGCGLSII